MAMWNNPPTAFPFRASPLDLLISRATAAHLPEPNYALHLEVAEYINQKKANNPREAAMSIVRLVNNRNPHVAMLALALLETLVQNCGYPFHLQISTKEFLNELVRRFPERPPPFPGPVMGRILDLINSWKEGICQDSRWRDDLGNIRDMHRLLTFKGYRFRELPRANAPAPAANLKSADELESEDREAQSAKLQELIRRGTPRDLAAAQELMKSLAGANPDAKPDYRTQVLTELNKLEQKVILLNEMLDNVDTERGERFARGDVYDQVASILIGSRPKIQKWISDAETDDSESLDTYLQINDQMNTVLERYEAFKKGDFTAAANPIPAELGPGKNELSLIDFDDPPEASATAAAGSSNPTNDLMDLFGPSTMASTSSHPRPMSMGMGAPAPPVATPSNGFPAAITPQFTSSPPGSIATSPQSRSSSSQFGHIMLPGTPQPTGQAQAQPMGAGAGIGMSAGVGKMGSPPFAGTTWGGMSPPLQPQSTQSQGASPTPGWGQPIQLQQQQQQQRATSQPAPAAAQQQQQGKDPFADLVGLF